MEEIKIQKIVHGGQGLGEMSDGRKVFVWNALPGETVLARIIKKKRSYYEAIAEEIVVASPERIDPIEENYLATSPWQMMTYKAENQYKAEIVKELFAHEKITLPKVKAVKHTPDRWHYRNKMEYSFWGDDDGLHLALHMRGSHGKQIVQGSALALPAIDAAANAICMQLSSMNARAGDLKTLIVRANQNGETVAAIFTKLEKFAKLSLPDTVKGLRVYHSNPKSPASVTTKLIYEIGDPQLQDKLLNKDFTYDVDSFFQVNVPIFSEVLKSIKKYASKSDVTDMYAGVGSIGLTVAQDKVALVELDSATAAMARLNAERSKLDVNVFETSTEAALDYIQPGKEVIFDPPRAGLHARVIERIETVLPSQIVYLSCNPATHARDIALLEDLYDLKIFEVYNFFPCTPHIETLAVLSLK